MISRRLTKIQKDEILEAYRDGENTNTLAEKYSCSSNTINRTVKTLLSDTEYKLLKEKRLKSSNKKLEKVNNESYDSKKEDIEYKNSFKSSQEKVNEEVQESLKTDDYESNSEFREIALLPIGELSESEKTDSSYIDKINQVPDNTFDEIVPLISNFDFEKKELDFKIYNQEVLPESVYMLVDKKVELEVKSISDFPEWSFLPENELERNAIILFSNQRSAKRSCSKSQRVIKVPNTNVFKVSKSYLISKGITRLIIEDSLIALDD